MASSEPAEPRDLEGLRLDVLRRAVDLYMALAYPGVEPPPVVRDRLKWSPAADALTLINGNPFEKAGQNKTSGAPIYALRLGNVRYPHMKLQIQPWPNRAGFMLSVNTHDQTLTVDPNAAGLAEFREVQAENQRLKEAIEQAWDEAELPTFLRYLREYIERRSGEGPGGAVTPPDR